MQSLLVSLSSSRTSKLKQIAAAQAAKVSRKSTYAPVPGAEHCPVCWTRELDKNPLRTEPHHNAAGVFAVVCGSCGFYLVL